MKKTLFLLVLILFFSNTLTAQRLLTSINSGWKFHQGDIDSQVNEINTENWEIVNLPHTWNVSDAFNETRGYYRGAGWYVKKLSAPMDWKGKRVFFKFEGANQTTELFLNGELIGKHLGGYTGFGFDLSNNLKYGEINTISVKVDNAHDGNIPPLRADYTFYGGIYRNVWLLVAEPIHFDLSNYASDGVFIDTPEVNEKKALVTVHGSLVNNTLDKKTVIIETTVIDKNNAVVANKSSKLVLGPNSKSEFSLENMEIHSPNLWSPDNPYLYKTITQISEDRKNSIILDKMVLPMGLRWFNFDDQNRFCLNGKPLKLVGASRHQDYKNLGNALTDDYHYNDYKHIKELGFNFVRLAHYPQAPEVYKTCDELGLLVWSEIPIVSGVTVSKEFSNNCIEMQKEHIRQTRNHPSVVLYGYMNEVIISLQFNRRLEEQDRQKTVNRIIELANQLDDLTKAEAPDRFTVMAMHHNTGYNEYGLTEIPDVVGWNLYFGWYYNTIEDLGKFLAEQHNMYPNQRMIVSEYGPGTDVRIHSTTPNATDFSEDFQYVMHASYLKQMMNLPYLAGFAAWNYADFGSSGRADAIPSINQKGLVNYDRSEKDVCGLYRAYFLNDPIIYIASRNFTLRTGIEQDKGTGICNDNVKIFTNQQEIELKLDGKVIGKKKVTDHEVNFNVPFNNGKNILTASDNNGHSDQVTIEYNVLPFHLDSGGVKDLAVNVGSDVSFYDPGTKVMWIPDRQYTEKSWGYIGGAPYTVQRRQLQTGVTQNILGTDCNPLFQTFVEGITGYRFDVPDGQYKLTLLFQEYNDPNGRNRLIYNLSTDDSSKDRKEREFDITINGEKAISKLNLERDYGSLRAVTFDFIINAENGKGIKVNFNPLSGVALLSGIRITCIP